MFISSTSFSDGKGIRCAEKVGMKDKQTSNGVAENMQ